MKQVFRKYLVPHEGNGHAPYLLRHRAAAGMIAIALVAQVLFLAQYWGVPGSALVGEIATTALVAQSNAERADEGLAPLKVNPLLTEAARRKAEDMAAKGYFAHYAPDGSTPWSWIAGAGYAYAAAGENLAVNFVESSDVTRAWMASPAHRANILSAKYAEVGIATAPGTYKGKDVVFVVQMFGTPLAFAPAAPTPVAAEPAAPEPAPAQVASAAPAPAPVRSILPRAKVAAPAASTAVPAAVTSTEATSTPGLAAEVIPVAYAQESAEAGPSPKTPLYALYAVLATFVAIALAIKLTKVRLRHPQLVLNGILVLVVLGGLVWYAEYATVARALVG